MEPITQETLFNAGVDIALDISRLVKQAEYYASIGDYPMWHLKLEAIERRMWPKFRGNKDARKEIEDINKNNIGEYRRYLKKVTNQKGRGRVSKKLTETVKTYLIEYEKSLIYWRDEFGYGMPLKEDARKAAWR